VTADLARDTAVHRLEEPGVYAASVPPDWSFIAPSGGVLMTTALRAMTAEVADPAFRILSATSTFCSPVPAGPVRVAVQVLRRGNVAVQVRGALSADPGAELGFEVSATFVRDRPGPALLGNVMPPATPPAESPTLEERKRHEDRRWPAFFRNFEWRNVAHRPYWEPGGSTAEPRVTYWVRYLAPQRLAGGAIDPLAIPPIADTMPPSVAQGLGPGHTSFDAPSLDLTIHFLEATQSEWLLVSTRARHAGAGYASSEAEIWSEDGRLVAHATQTMILRGRRRD
jgi:acyl-CoA thioesterase